jgi:hypothetical protein
MRGSQVTCKFIEGIMPNEDTWGDIDHTVIRVEFLDGGASLRRVTFSENFLKVTEEQLVNSFGHIFFSLLNWSLFAADSACLVCPLTMTYISSISCREILLLCALTVTLRFLITAQLSILSCRQVLTVRALY